VTEDWLDLRWLGEELYSARALSSEDEGLASMSLYVNFSIRASKMIK
jgi:hypothetical protein